jgi:hypothetical protein
VSLGKCSILYRDECTAEVQDEIKGILKYDTTCFEEKYLGLPIPEGRMTKGKFKSTKVKFSKHASDWSEKYMSSGRRIFLSNPCCNQYQLMPWACSDFLLA